MKAFSDKGIALLALSIAIAGCVLAAGKFQTVPGRGVVSAAESDTVEPSAADLNPADMNPADPANQLSESALPTQEDRQLAQEFTLLVAELDKPPSLGREVVNATRDAEVSNSIKALESETPVSSRTLARARRHVHGLLPRLQELKKLTPPAPAFITARRGKLVLDGKLDESAWWRAVEVPIQFQRLEKIGEAKAKARLLWDSQFLYVGFEVQDTNIIAPVLERDSDVWRYDCIELFLMPSQRFGTYWEVEISPTGSILDYLCYKYPNQWGSDLNTGETMHGLQIGRTIRGTANQEGDLDEGYTIEVAIPFNQMPGLQKGPKKGDQIYVLLGWVNNDTGASSSSITSLAQVPYVGWFHNIWAYQPFNFVDKIPEPGKSDSVAQAGVLR